MTTSHRIIPMASAEAWLQPVQGARVLLEGTCNLGRLPENHVVIQSPKASRYHAAIHAQDALEFWLVDLGSRNGTFHNGRKIIRPTLLADGDRISLAGVTFLFRQITVLPPGTPIAGQGAATIVEFKDEPAWLLIADIVDFVDLGQRLAPDELAARLNTWTEECQGVIEQHRGQIGKYLGDGFLAYWNAENSDPARVVSCLQQLREHHLGGKFPPFRVSVHHGVVTFGGSTALGEERMIGGDVNFIFRQERLAKDLVVGCCLSAPACQELGALVSAERLPGEHAIRGFAGRHAFYRLPW